MVGFQLTPKQQMARKFFAEFAEKEVRPRAKEMDEREAFDMDLLELLKKQGMMVGIRLKPLGNKTEPTNCDFISQVHRLCVFASGSVITVIFKSICIN